MISFISFRPADRPDFLIAWKITKSGVQKIEADFLPKIVSLPKLPIRFGTPD